MAGRRKKNKWQKKVMRLWIKRMKEKQKTFKAKEKIHRKAVKARRKKVEKDLDRLLVAGCFVVCLAAAILDAKKGYK